MGLNAKELWPVFNPPLLSRFSNTQSLIRSSMLMTPLVGLAVGIGLIPFSIIDNDKVYLSLNFIIATLLFSNIHIGLTFAALVVLPEFQAYIRKSDGYYSFYSKTLFTFFGFFALAAIASKLLPVPLHQKTLFALIGLLKIYLLHHTLSQTHGISRLLNIQIPGDMQAMSELSSISNFEKKISLSLTWIMVSSVTLILCMSYLSIGTRTLTRTVGVIALCLVLLLIVLAKKWESHGAKDKFLFSFRLLSYPFALLVDFRIGSLLIYLNHGLEYLHTFSTIRTNTSASSKERRNFDVFSVLFVILAFLLILGRWDGLPNIFSIPASSPSSRYLNFLGTLSSALTFTHIYLDRRLFSWRYSAAAQTTGKLFSGLQ